MDQRCLILSYFFPPTGAGGVQRISKLVKYGSAAGWEFTVITAEPTNPGIPEDASLLSEIPTNVKIINIPAQGKIINKTGLTHRSTYWKRWLSALIYLPDPFKSWLPQAKKAVLKEWESVHYDCLLISAPPYSLTLLAAELYQQQGIPVIMDMRDPWTENPYKMYASALHRWKDRKLELQTISKIPFGTSAYGSLINFYQHQIPGFDSGNWATISNGYDEQDFEQLKTIPTPAQGFNIAFSGTFYSHINNPTPLLKALALIKKMKKGIAPRINFYHVGKSNINFERLIKKYDVAEQCFSLGYLPHEQALAQLSGMDALLFILDDRDPRSANTIGGKVYEYLRLKKPILALVPEKGEAANLIRKTNSGKVVSPGKINEIAAVLQNWNQTYPNYTFVNLKHFSRKNQTEQFLQMMIRASKN